MDGEKNLEFLLDRIGVDLPVDFVVGSGGLLLVPVQTTVFF